MLVALGTLLCGPGHELVAHGPAEGHVCCEAEHERSGDGPQAIGHEAHEEHDCTLCWLTGTRTPTTHVAVSAPLGAELRASEPAGRRPGSRTWKSARPRGPPAVA